MTTCDTSRAHQSKEGTRSRSNAASAQVNNEASYANVRSDVMQAAYEAGLAGAKVHRLKCVRAQLQRHHPDLDLRGLAPEVLFKNMSPADIDALDEAAFQASIDEWKRANDILVVSNAGSIAGRTDHSRRPKKAEGAKPRGASTSDYHGVSAAPSKKNPWQARATNPVSLGARPVCQSFDRVGSMRFYAIFMMSARWRGGVGHLPLEFQPPRRGVAVTLGCFARRSFLSV